MLDLGGWRGTGDLLVKAVVILQLFGAHFFAHTHIFDDLLSQKELQELRGLLTGQRSLRFGGGVCIRLEIAAKPIDGLRSREAVGVGAKVAPVSLERQIGEHEVDDLTKLENVQIFSTKSSAAVKRERRERLLRFE